jgi:hypothetical protein
MLEEYGGLATAECREPASFRSAPGSSGVSLRPTIPGGLLPGRARFRFAGHRQ